MFSSDSFELEKLRDILKLHPDIHDITAFFQANEEEWLHYDGKIVTWYSGSYGRPGRVIARYKATSGLPGYQTARYMNVKDAGPVPEGKYWILLLPNPNRVAKADKRTGELLANKEGGIEKIPVQFTRQDGSTVIYPGWGNIRARLFPDTSTKTLGRSNFYLHDSHKGFSHGCIEVEPALFTRLVQIRTSFTKIALQVDYPTDQSSTNGGTKW